MAPIAKSLLKGVIVSFVSFFVLTHSLSYILVMLGLGGAGAPIFVSFIILGAGLVSLVIFLLSIAIGIDNQSNKSYNRDLSETDIRFFIYGGVAVVFCVIFSFLSYLSTTYK